MIKLCLAAITALLLPNVVLAAACPTGTDTAPPAGCIIINTSDTTYALTGDIAPASGAIGLYLHSSNRNTTTVNGNISTTGDSARGLYLYNSDSNTIHLNGRVTATGTGSNAIDANNGADNNIIVFNRGASIIGGLDNDGANNSLTFNLGQAASYNFTTSGAVNWVLDDTTKSVIAGSAKSRGVADMNDAGNRLYQRLSHISDSLNNQQRQISLERDRGDYWIDSYYSNNERKAFLKEIDQNTHGITVGFNASGDRDLAMDVVLNYENSDAAYGSSEQTTKSNSMMVGLFFPQLKTTANGSMAVKFLAGMSDNDRDLIVLNNTVSSGQEIITDQYDSTYVTAGASWIKSKYERERFSNWQFLLSMDINHEQIEASSASAYYHLDDRDITQLVNQAQYSFTMQGMNKRLQLNGSFGLAHTRNIDGRAQTYTIDGTALSFISEKKSTYTTRSVGATYQLNPSCYAYANAKWVDNSDDINGTTGNVGLVVNF